MISLALPLVLAFTSPKPQEPPADAAKVELKLDAKTVAPGGTVKGKVLVTFAEGWHGYQNPPMRDYEIPLKLTSATKGLILKPTYPKGKEIMTAGAKTWAYEGTVAVPVALSFPKKTGAFAFKIDVGYQQCNEQTCLPPDKVSVEGKVVVLPPKPVKAKPISGEG